ncbi:hypothetical protein EGW08_004346 [Elysia chlorotica]|uniref:Ig-like domain-containing protein n=1 Tax=Elysia chlorotica TaxID=188477 RepID=A0A433U2B1_ELYCH|nr:hypothetical protein EGW08_004346 [Elysia chlorotica]
MEMSELCSLQIALLCCFVMWDPVRSIWLDGAEHLNSISGHPLIIDCKVYEYNGEQLSWSSPGHNPDSPPLKGELMDVNGQKVFRLTIENADSNDSGLYRCKTAAGTEEKVVYADIVTVRALGTNVSEGFDATLKCEITPDNVAGSITWRRDGLPLDQIPSLKDRISLEQENASLTIKNAKLSDAGTYVCEISLRGNTIQTFKENVVLQGQPYRDETVPADKVFSASEGSVTLKCPVKGTPQPQVFWQRGEDVLEPDDKYTMTDVDGVASASLEIAEPEKEDFGEYVCTAENVMGKVDVTFRVISATLAQIPGGDSEAQEGGRGAGLSLWRSPPELLALLALATVLVVVARVL